MHILIGLLLAIALFWFWLVAHWFARVLMFLLLGTGGFLISVACAAEQPTALILGLFGLVIAWYVAAIPTYYWQRRQRIWHA